jgi:hypothetical protein
MNADPKVQLFCGAKSIGSSGRDMQAARIQKLSVTVGMEVGRHAG